MIELDGRLILGSKSPRRHHLLKEAGFDFEIMTRDVPEDFPDALPKKEVALYLADKKAEACRDFLQQPKDILLTADSTVVIGNQIYNKPEDLEDARNMLAQLSGKVHVVYTGVCLVSEKKKVLLTGVSEVKMAPLSQEEIDYYVNKYQPLDKAGAYAIQEWIGLCKIEWLKGTYSNIMGLPVHQVYEALKNW